MNSIKGIRRSVAVLTVAVAGLGFQQCRAQQLSHAQEFLLHDSFELISAGPSNDSDAARFLAQATFGPTTADIAHLRSIGYQAWLTEQFNASPSMKLPYITWVSGTLQEPIGYSTLLEAWFNGALGGPDPQTPSVIHSDQLRQRVAFALSEIFVVSDQNTMLDQHPDGLAYYYDILSTNAFGNFRTLLEQVTLSPAMGIYLNMLGNQRADLSQNLHPDENYAREINQLFTIGLVMLNVDGSQKLAAGQPIPTYSQSVVSNFAHVFTGWNWATCPVNNYSGCISSPGVLDYQQPMVPFVAHHDNGTDTTNDVVNKQLLSYPGAVSSDNSLGSGVLGSGGTPQSDLTFALNNIFQHPNVAPFISKQLIQRLVTSNPTPAYVGRVAAIFNDDGSESHVRGNLRAVIQAILLDSEARLGQWQAPDAFGKLREPLLRLTHFWRATGSRHHCGKDFTSGGVSYHYANPYRFAGFATAWDVADSVYASGVGQAPLDADTVFNFFKPTFVPQGEMAQRNLFGPEFQTDTDTLSTNSTTSIATKTFGIDLTATACTGDSCPPNSCTDQMAGFGDVAINRAEDLPLAGSTTNGGKSDPADNLVNAYNTRFMSGQMSPFMRQALLNVLNPIGASTAPADTDWRSLRVNVALLLILTSPEYMVQK